MRFYEILPIILGILTALITCPNLINGQNPETKFFTTFPNERYTDKLLDNSKLLDSNYTPDQINEIIYHLYQEIQNSDFTKFGHVHDIAILIDFICSNESIENAVEACDIVSELPLDD